MNTPAAPTATSTDAARQGRRNRRHRPRHREAPAHSGVPAPAVRPGSSCCRTSTTEHRTLGGTVVRTRWHHPACPLWTAR
ncbi:hypothetical protein ACWGB8_33150 [Kitasatospora sp. NPDC054939]